LGSADYKKTTLQAGFAPVVGLWLPCVHLPKASRAIRQTHAGINIRVFPALLQDVPRAIRRQKPS
jgi:hypothetical protein